MSIHCPKILDTSLHHCMKPSHISHDLLCVEWDVKLYSLTHSLLLFFEIGTATFAVAIDKYKKGKVEEMTKLLMVMV